MSPELREYTHCTKCDHRAWDHQSPSESGKRRYGRCKLEECDCSRFQVEDPLESLKDLLGKGPFGDFLGKL